MNAKDAVRRSIASPDQIVDRYLGDLTDADLMTRPVPGANHIAWQLGHLIKAEHELIERVAPGSMPPLPAGFAEQYTNDTAGLDDPKAFLTKEEYLRLLKEQRAGTLAALDKMSDADLDRATPPPLDAYFPKLVDIFLLQGMHRTMHAGQWAVARRKLGKPPLF